ncbi:MAG: acyl-CoA thioesterase [Rhodospirillaceae bacterium]|nr:acyl-CoA thioesterase [Rhodospirillaceae bacterium]
MPEAAKSQRPEPPTLDRFPHRTYDKLRYRDTDRQGHVNNAVFATLLDTGRTELFYDPDRPFADTGCTFVTARLTIDFLAEINWPGRVDVGTRIGKIGRSSTTVDQALFQDGRCVATATAIVVQVGADGRGQAFSQHAIDVLTSYGPGLAD